MNRKLFLSVITLSVLFIFSGLYFVNGLGAGKISSQMCLECHGDEDLEPETERGKTLKLFVDEIEIKSSIHKNLSCTNCHGGAKDWTDAPHNDGKPLNLMCKSCHNEVTKEYNKSIHGISYSRGDKEAAMCYNCHGSHGILPSRNSMSKTNKFNLHKTCAICHESKLLVEKHDIGKKEAVAQFVDSIHGRALLVDGLVVAPSCNDCHGVHDILPHTHPDSNIHKDVVPKTCGKCHVLVEDVYNRSVHGKLLKANDSRGPVCITCHTSHTIEEPTGEEFKLQSDRMCGKCHMDRLEKYRDTFHGKALALGRKEVAACFDCHGHHDIMESKDPKSYVSDERRTQTCKKCHEGANDNFAQYIVHADHTNSEDYPLLYYTFLLMTILLLGTFAFFAGHTVMWLVRSFALFRGDSKDWLEQKERIKNDTEQYIRFSPLERFLHGLVITSFLLSVITGMPLKFYYADWAKVLLDIMGGQAVAAVLHRVAAIITVFYFTVHIISVIYGFLSNWKRFLNPETGKLELKRIIDEIFGPDSPMPNMQDLRDVISHNKWFFGKGEKPQFGRWTYWEKFDYMAVFWGVGMIGVSGLIMWFPEFFTKFLPGWVINVSLIIHSDEALLAAGFIFAFHFFNVHFRPEKFPMDTVMFSGKISKEELISERKKQYDLWVERGELEKHRVKDEWESKKLILVPAGVTAFLIGVILIILIFSAMFSRLLFG